MAGKYNDFRDDIAREIIAQIEAGTAPWQKPWEPGVVAMPPFNPTTGNPYRGINDLALSMKGYADPRWMTYRQAAAIGAQVRKGEKGTYIERWQWTERQPAIGDDGKPLLDAEGNRQFVEVPLPAPRVFYATVFNGSQIDGLEPFVAAAPAFDPIDRAEAILASAGVAMFEDRQDEAFYRIDKDEIHVPPRDRFPNAAGFYATALHELGHATRHPSRLDRPNGPFGSEMYAREELRAEIASYMLGRELGIGHDPSKHASYVGSWLTALKNDRDEIFLAARDAEIIKTWLMEPEKRQALEKAAQERAAAERSEERTMEQPIARVFLSVPFAERGAAREAGARFDGDAKRWYVPEGKDPAAFTKWADQSQSATIDRGRSATSPTSERAAQSVAPGTAPSAEPKERVFIAVPYSERFEAKKLGAKWSGRDKSWWIPEGVDPKPLEKWLPGAAATKTEDVSPEKEFGDFLKSHGLVVDRLVMDGEWHRVPVEGDHGNQKSGSYVGFLADPNKENDRAAGLATNFKGAQGTQKWVATGAAMSAEQRADLAARLAQSKARRADDRRQAAEQSAKRAYGVWVNLPDGAGPQNCPYLAAKGVQAHGVKVASDGNLVVPQRDADGRLWGVQFCSAAGKRYLKDSLHVGTMHVIERSGKGTLDAISPSMGGLIIIAEGYATAARLHEATGRPVVVAFDSGNLEAVARVVKERHPERELLIAADNDHAVVIGGKPVNVGMVKAEAAAHAVGALWTAPKFTEEEKAQKLTDFDDLGRARGNAAVKQAIDAALSRHRGADLARGVA